MFVSIRDCLLLDEAFGRPVDGLRRLGLDAIELELRRDYSVFLLDERRRVVLASDSDAVAYRAHLDGLGVRACALLTACDWCQAGFEENVAWVERAVQLAHLLGAKAIRIDTVLSHERELDVGRRVMLFVNGLSVVLERTRDVPVQLGIENHGVQGNDLAFLLGILDRIDSARLGYTLDVGNFYWSGYPLAEVYGILRLLARYTVHTHFKNIRYPVEMRERDREAGWEYAKHVCPLDEGDIDLVQVVRLLAAAGYRGDLCIEDESLGRCASPAERVAVLERDVQHLRAALTTAR